MITAEPAATVPGPRAASTSASVAPRGSSTSPGAAADGASLRNRTSVRDSRSRRLSQGWVRKECSRYGRPRRPCSPFSMPCMKCTLRRKLSGQRKGNSRSEFSSRQVGITSGHSLRSQRHLFTAAGVKRRCPPAAALAPGAGARELREDEGAVEQPRRSHAVAQRDEVAVGHAEVCLQPRGMRDRLLNRYAVQPLLVVVLPHLLDAAALAARRRPPADRTRGRGPAARDAGDALVVRLDARGGQRSCRHGRRAEGEVPPLVVVLFGLEAPQPRLAQPPELAVHAPLGEGDVHVEAAAPLAALLHEESVAAAEEAGGERHQPQRAVGG
mmetsp:Transcript_15146/g.45076  ORF Transcript_15146/g.45076 Transcript_15146/m.45076 type:complete len:327 (-) Transcript_15146:1221-2201(-)